MRRAETRHSPWVWSTQLHLTKEQSNAPTLKAIL